jgi:hypothetical protein
MNMYVVYLPFMSELNHLPQISAYVVVPDPELSERVGALELSTAIEYLATETKSQQRKVSPFGRLDNRTGKRLS